MVENSDFTPSQVGCLFTFLARQLAKPDNTLFVNRTLFDQVLLELLQAGGIVQFEESRLIRMAEKAEFYQICEFMYEREHQYDKIIDCYLRDPLREEEVFNYIHNILSIPGHSAEEKQSVWQKAMDHIEELVSLKPCKAAELVATHFSEQIETVIKKLQLHYAEPVIIIYLLDLSYREGIHINQESLQISPCITEQFIELLCQFSPNQVIDTLQVLECYRLEETVQITQKYQLHEVTAYLLEKKGDIHGAFLIMLECCCGCVIHSSSLAFPVGQIPGCKKGERKTEGGVVEHLVRALWFPLLEAMMAPQKLSSSAAPPLHSEALKSLTMQVLNSMAAFIALPSILQRILQDPVYGKGKLGEIQGLILGMLDTFNYEQYQNIGFSMFSNETSPLVKAEGKEEKMKVKCGPLLSTVCSDKSCRLGTCVLLSIRILGAFQLFYYDTKLSQNRSSDSCRPFGGSQSGSAFNSIFQKENFQLQLIPPPVTED
ncbi:hypothetical protein CB1_000660003 [Camelus ferus]|nr:hypothetical protein CB1_000660003 [Camelus ferus]